MTPGSEALPDDVSSGCFGRQGGENGASAAIGRCFGAEDELCCRLDDAVPKGTEVEEGVVWSPKLKELGVEAFPGVDFEKGCDVNEKAGRLF